MAVIASATWQTHALGNLPGSWTAVANDDLFTGVQQKVAGRATVVNSPARTGTQCASFVVQSGDNNVAGSGAQGERCEVCCGSSVFTGDGNEVWIKFAVLFPGPTTGSPEFNPTSGTEWNYFFQVHNSASGQANFSFEWNMSTATTSPDTAPVGALKLRHYGGAQDANRTDHTLIASAQKDTWYEFVVGIKWKTDDTGWMEVWVNGNNVLPRYFKPTYYTGQTAYIKAGIYRLQNAATSRLFHDDIIIGNTRADVDPASGGGGSGSGTRLNPVKGNHSQGTANSSSCTFSHTVPSGTSNRLLLVSCADAFVPSVTGMTYGGTPLTLVTGSALNNGSAAGLVWYYLLNPTPGTANVVVSLSSARRVVCGAVDFYNVDQTTPLVGSVTTANGNNLSALLSVNAVASDEIVVASLAARAQTTRSCVDTAAATELVNTEIVTGGDGVRSVIATKPGGSTVSFSWTLGDVATDRWITEGLRVQGVVGTPTSPTTNRRFPFKMRIRGLPLG